MSAISTRTRRSISVAGATDSAVEFPLSRMGFVPSLEGLRGIAIAVVFAVHLYSPLFPGGNSGVDLFFVLSGFLITKLAYEEHDRSASFSRLAFYKRRVARILPALLVVVAVILIGSFTFIRDLADPARREALFATLSIGNLWPIFYGAEERPLLAHTWSLGIEEQFYFVWPMLLAYVPMAFRQPRRFLGWVAGVTAASIVIGRVVMVGVLDYDHWGSIPLFDFDGLALGCMLAIAMHTGAVAWLSRIPEWAAWAALGVIGLDFLLVNPDTLGDRFGLRKLVVRVLFGVVIVAVMMRRNGTLARLLTWAPLRFLGKISYSLYLWHVPVFAMLANDRFPDQPRTVMIALRVLVSFAAALVSYHFIEQPVLRWFRGRHHPAQASA